MAELTFACLGARAEQYTVAPTLAFTIRIAETTGIPVHAIALRVQIRIQPHARQYSDAEAERLTDLFGERSRWGDTLKAIQFTAVTAMVPGFTGSVDIDLPVPCTYDLEVACGRYFNALDDGEVPLLLLYSGTVFARQGDRFAVDQVPWSEETAYRLPVAVWREMVDRYFPDSGWLKLRRDTIDALATYKSRRALPTWDATLDALLASAEEEVGRP